MESRHLDGAQTRTPLEHPLRPPTISKNRDSRLKPAGEWGIIHPDMNLKDYIGEATAYDKKLMLARKGPTSWLKSVSAFANIQGGRLLFGVANDGMWIMV